jgi:hypothetical protein
MGFQIYVLPVDSQIKINKKFVATRKTTFERTTEVFTNQHSLNFEICFDTLRYGTLEVENSLKNGHPILFAIFEQGFCDNYIESL